MTEQRQKIFTQLGFRIGMNVSHSAFILMLDNLRVLLANISPQATRTEYVSAAVDSNVLGNPTRNAREAARQAKESTHV